MDLTNFTFPFPQLFIGSSTFALYEDSIELLDGNMAVVDSITTLPGDVWHVADFGAFFVFTNGVQVLTYDPVNEFLSAPNMPKFKTCCAFNGQLFSGAFLSEIATPDPDPDPDPYEEPYEEPDHYGE